jgi:uncharacterized membrane protein
MTDIKSSTDIKKLEAHLRVKARGRFTFDPDLLKEILVELKNHAEQFNVEISLETVDETTQEVLLFTSGGALIGGVVGFMLAHIPGALIGGIVGATIGACMASISLTLRHEDEKLVLQIN